MTLSRFRRYILDRETPARGTNYEAALRLDPLEHATGHSARVPHTPHRLSREESSKSHMM